MNYFFEKIIDNQYIYSFNLANVDGLHRNRLGSNGCKGLNKLLKNNKVLAMIDIADNSIGNEGIRNMLKGVDPHESNIAYINLSNNGLSQGCINELSNLLNSSSLQEIRLKENQLNDFSAQELAYFFYRGKCQLSKLDLSYNCLTSSGAAILSHALKLNPYLTHLNLENNQLGKGGKFSKITIMLKSNKILKSLNLSKCDLDCVDAEAIADGLFENKALETLNLSKNRIMDKGAICIFESLQSENTKLSNLDLSSNSIHNECIEALVETLRVNQVLQKISLFNNMITESVGRGISVAIKNNKSIQVINLAHNSLEKQDMLQIKDYCKRNIQNAEKIGLPVIREQLLNLMQSEEGIQLTEDELQERIRRCKKERSELEQEFNREQDKFDILKFKQTELYSKMIEMKDKADFDLYKLDEEEEQVILKEAGLAKQFEKDEEDLQFKISMIKNQEKITRGVIQQHLDKIDIRNRDRQSTLFKMRKELERVSKKMLFKQLEFESTQKAVEDLKNELEQIDKLTQAKKSISTLRRTRSSYYKGSKSIESPCKS